LPDFYGGFPFIPDLIEADAVVLSPSYVLSIYFLVHFAKISPHLWFRYVRMFSFLYSIKTCLCSSRSVWRNTSLDLNAKNAHWPSYETTGVYMPLRYSSSNTCSIMCLTADYFMLYHLNACVIGKELGLYGLRILSRSAKTITSTSVALIAHKSLLFFKGYFVLTNTFWMSDNNISICERSLFLRSNFCNKHHIWLLEEFMLSLNFGMLGGNFIGMFFISTIFNDIIPWCFIISNHMHRCWLFVYYMRYSAVLQYHLKTIHLAQYLWNVIMW
jgi:hypothetical protein